MNTFQTLCSIVLLIFVLSVIVQAVNEFIKRALDTKANVMRQTIDKFMGDLLPLPKVEESLKARGLDITAFENLNKESFRHLLDGIDDVTFQIQQLYPILAAHATVDQIKDNIAASYEAVRALFQKTYTTRNKLFGLVLSFFIVIILNANIIILYEQVSADQVAQQAIMGRAVTASTDQALDSGKDQTQQIDLGKAYSNSREQIDKELRNYPILIRTSKLAEDFDRPFIMIFGLLIMGVLVSLGAPFWNDVLKGMMGINGALNTNAKQSS